MNERNLIDFLLDEIKRCYNSRGFSQFNRYSDDILAKVAEMGLNKREAAIYLGLIESELSRRNKKPSTRVLAIDDYYKRHLGLLLKENRKIGYIEKGVVIDHLPSGIVFDVARMLGVDKDASRVSLGKGYPSTKRVKKGILKIEGRDLTEQELGLIAKIAEGATISTIKDGKVVEKKILGI